MPNYSSIEKAMAVLADSYVLQYLLAENFKSKPDPQAASNDFLASCEAVCARLKFDQFDAFESDLAAQLFKSALSAHGLRAQALAVGAKSPLV